VINQLRNAVGEVGYKCSVGTKKLTNIYPKPRTDSLERLTQWNIKIKPKLHSRIN
jgi:hypothetical protein